jgi:MFS family permease
VTPPFKFVLLASLYLAQGLPFGFFTQALPVLLRERGLSLAAIGASGLLFLPWGLKFLWAPLVDHTGSRKAWILTLQLLTFAGALALSQADLEASLIPIFAALLLFNLLAATQDVAADGLAVRLLSPVERGLGNGVQVGAYRIGMILGGGALLWLFAQAGWSAMFLGMAGILLLTCVPVLFLRRDPLASTVPQPARGGGLALLAGWGRRLRRPGVVGFIALICAYKFGDAMASSLVGPFMHDSGLSKQEIAWVKGTIGSVMGLAGAALGGWLAWRFGRRPALIACGILQTASLLLYVACAMHPGAKLLLYASSTAEHLLGGMATVALFTLMMDASDPDHAGTLLACAVVLSGGLAGIVAGLCGDTLGYTGAFGLSFLVSGIGCLLLVVGLDRGRGPRRLDTVWPRGAA